MIQKNFLLFLISQINRLLLTLVAGSVLTTHRGVPVRKTPSTTSIPIMIGSLLLNMAPGTIFKIQGNTA